MRPAIKFAIAFAALAAFLALGYYLRSHPEPAFFVSWERALFDRATLVAWWLTWSCYVDVLGPICIALLVVAWRLPAWRTRVFLSIVALLISWRGADLFQHVFMRARPLHWVVKHETAFSYPSSHAAIVTGFYALWGGLLYASELSRAVRVTAAWVLGVFCVGVLWSRLALGAHYVTDLAGGILLGAFVVMLGLAIVGDRLTPHAGRLSATAE